MINKGMYDEQINTFHHFKKNYDKHKNINNVNTQHLTYEQLPVHMNLLTNINNEEPPRVKFRRACRDNHTPKQQVAHIGLPACACHETTSSAAEVLQIENFISMATSIH